MFLVDLKWLNPIYAYLIVFGNDFASAFSIDIQDFLFVWLVQENFKNYFIYKMGQAGSKLNHKLESILPPPYAIESSCLSVKWPFLIVLLLLTWDWREGGVM